MELLTYLEKGKNEYTRKINKSLFLQNSSIKKTVDKDIEYRYYSSLDELIISLKEPEYYLDENKELFYNNIKLLIANKLDENKKEFYEKFNFCKQFDTTMIQTGLQENNNLSTLVYLSHYYNINIYILNDSLYYNHLDKNEKNIYVECDSNGWKLSKNNFDLEKIDILPINKFVEKTFVKNNLKKGNNIYNLHLNPISKYKMPELIEIAKKNNIDLIDKKTGKKKIKKQLYDDINYKYL